MSSGFKGLAIVFGLTTGLAAFASGCGGDDQGADDAAVTTRDAGTREDGGASGSDGAVGHDAGATDAGRGGDAGRAPDAGTRDAGAGSADAGLGHDAASVVDAGPHDAGEGLPLDEVCHADGECRSGFCDDVDYCGDDGDFGVCAVRPTTCDGDAGPGARPVCGCDGVTYPSDCARRLVRMALDYDGACDPAGACTARTPRNQCYDNEDCSPRGGPALPFARRCLLAGACGSGTIGKCIPVPFVDGQCWVDADCATGHCTGAFICPVGETCPMTDHSGTCGS